MSAAPKRVQCSVNIAPDDGERLNSQAEASGLSRVEFLGLLIELHGDGLVKALGPYRTAKDRHADELQGVLDALRKKKPK